MKFSTGLVSLDKVLGGGYETGVLMEFFGQSQGLKTTLSSYVPIGRIYLHWLKNNPATLKDHAFFVVDGDGGFDFERAAQVWKGQGCSEKQVEHIITLIRYFQPTTFADQHSTIIHDLPGIIQPTKDEVKAGKVPVIPLLLVADPLIAIYRDRMLTTPRKFKMVATGEYTGKLGQELNKLRHLAVRHNCPCIVTSWPGSPVKMKNKDGSTPTAEQPMIGGRAFGFLAKTIISLSIPVEGLPQRRATLVKHRSRPVGLSCNFRVTEKGVEDLIQTRTAKPASA